MTAAVEAVNNSRINEGLAGGPEGSFNGTDWSTSRLRNYQLDGEVSFPTSLGSAENIWTLGFEYLDSRLTDPYSMSQSSSSGGGIPGCRPIARGQGRRADHSVRRRQHLPG